MKAVFLITTLIFFCSLTAKASNLEQANNEFAAGDYGQASQSYKALLKLQPDDPSLSYLLARSYRKDGDNKRANEVLEKSLVLFPDNIDNLYLVGSVKMDLISDASVFKKLGLAKGGLKAWQRVVTLDPKHHEARYGISTYYIIAPSIAGGSFDKAEAEITKLRTVSPAWADLALATLKEKQEDFTSAQALYSSSALAIKDRAFPYFVLADFLIKQGKLTEALGAHETYQDLIRTWNDPGQRDIEIISGRIQAGLGNVALADKHYNAALALAKSKSMRGYIRKLQQTLKDA